MPGVASGTHEPGLSIPALPNEQYSPGGRMSTIVTSWPSRRRYAAVATPTMPAPIIVIFFAIQRAASQFKLRHYHPKSRVEAPATRMLE
jgi:hypothetical protein